MKMNTDTERQRVYKNPTPVPWNVSDSFTDYVSSKQLPYSCCDIIHIGDCQCSILAALLDDLTNAYNPRSPAIEEGFLIYREHMFAMVTSEHSILTLSQILIRGKVPHLGTCHSRVTCSIVFSWDRIFRYTKSPSAAEGL